MPTALDLAHGLHSDIPEAVYHARVKELASKSVLERIRKAPSKHLAWLLGQEDETSDALEFGRLFHCALLEPERYAAEYTILPNFGDCRAVQGRTTKEQGAANKAAKAAWMAEHNGLKMVEADDHATVASMIASARRHPLISAMLAGGERECTIRWRDSATGVECKARADSYTGRLGICLDAKSAEDASPEGFLRAVEVHGYHRQAAMYLDGLAAVGAEMRAFRFFAIEKKAPFDCAVYDLDEEALLVGRRQNHAALARFAECLRSDTWPSYSAATTTLSLRPWAAMAA